MKSANKYDEVATLAPAAFHASESFRAANFYCHAALRDEGLGFTLTAAMEWQMSAELFVMDSEEADRCWQQWERIMGIPRSFAQPIHEPSAAPALASTSELAAVA